MSPTVFLFLFLSFLPSAFPYAETGKWSIDIKNTGDLYKPFAKSMYNGTSVFLKVSCSKVDLRMTLKWVLRRTSCAQEYLSMAQLPEDKLNSRTIDYLEHPQEYLMKVNLMGEYNNCVIEYTEGSTAFECDGTQASQELQLDPIRADKCPKKASLKSDVNQVAAASSPLSSRRRRSPDEGKAPKPKSNHSEPKSEVTRAWSDGVYLFIVKLGPSDKNVSYEAKIDVDIKADYGYLSAEDYPKRPFFLTLCLIYVFYAVVWLVVLACNWRDLLQIQFWIGGVIILGMLEKAVFYSEYQNINSTGVRLAGAELFAEIVSCAKRTLARMLVIIVSLGFGIVKPRLGPLLHRIMMLGCLYFILGSIEAALRDLKHSADQSQQLLLAQIPLAVIDAGICWWVFSSLVQTMRILRLRRNTTKLSLFRHLTNVIIFGVVASIIFMIWSIRSHKVVECLQDWKELWVDDAFWHALFSILLAVIMVLWRPTANNQRYAFSALLDDPEDADPEEEPMIHEAFGGVKLRSHVSESAPREVKTADEKLEEDLKWVEENIPTSVADAALPSLLDSDEEIMTTKFEMSKME